MWRTGRGDPAQEAARDVSRMFAGLPGLRQLVDVAERERQRGPRAPDVDRVALLPIARRR